MEASTEIPQIESREFTRNGTTSEMNVQKKEMKVKVQTGNQKYYLIEYERTPGRLSEINKRDDSLKPGGFILVTVTPKNILKVVKKMEKKFRYVTTIATPSSQSVEEGNVYLTNKWKAEERKRKIDAILRDSIKELEQENIDLKKEVENLKNKTNNNNE